MKLDLDERTPLTHPEDSQEHTPSHRHYLSILTSQNLEKMKLHLSELTPLKENYKENEPPRPGQWTRKDYLLLIFNVMVKFGDAVQFYLPGVITQEVSCELGVSAIQEGWLGVVMFLTLAAFCMITVPLTNRFGQRLILFFSLYTAIIFTIICAVVPNYYTLLLSRALTGLCIGLNLPIVGIYYNERASSRKVYLFGNFVTTFFFAVGGGFVGILGYLVLERLGWRVFVLSTALPLFIPPIILLHFCLKDDKIEASHDEEDCVKKMGILVPNTKVRIFKSSMFMFLNMFIGTGGILLLPSLLRQDNEDEDPFSQDSCDNVVRGSQFLLLAVVSGGTNILGRIAGYFLVKRVKFRVLQLTLALLISISYGSMLYRNNILITVIVMGIGKFVYSIVHVEIALMMYDPVYFGTAGLILGAGMMNGMGAVGGVVGTAVASFLRPHYAVIYTFAMTLFQFVVVFSITER